MMAPDKGGVFMTKWALMFAVVFSAACFAAPGQSTDPQTSSANQAVSRIENEMLDGLRKGDPAPSEHYLAETYIFTSPDGGMENKAQSVADLKTGDLKFQSVTMEDPKFSVYGDTVIVTFGSIAQGTYKGKDISGKTRWTDVFVKQDGHWRLVASHGSPVVQQAPAS
jgi:ketosteroid isomerase-like protein